MLSHRDASNSRERSSCQMSLLFAPSLSFERPPQVSVSLFYALSRQETAARLHTDRTG